MSDDLIVNEELEVEEVAEAEAEPAEVESTDRVDAWSELEAKKNYRELEQFNSRQAQEVGQLRKTVDQLLQEPQQPSKEIDLDALLENPADTINQSVSSSPELKTLQDAVKTITEKTALTEVKTKHPDAEKIWKDPAFQNWATENPVRRRLAEEANNYNVDSADYILSEWKSHNSDSKQELEESARIEKARSDIGKAASEGAGGASAQKTFSRVKLAKLKITDPDRYNDMWETEIYPAYQDGRVR